jgi:hypothetical protein
MPEPSAGWPRARRVLLLLALVSACFVPNVCALEIRWEDYWEAVMYHSGLGCTSKCIHVEELLRSGLLTSGCVN